MHKLFALATQILTCTPPPQKNGGNDVIPVFFWKTQPHVPPLWMQLGFLEEGRGHEPVSKAEIRATCQHHPALQRPWS